MCYLTRRVEFWLALEVISYNNVKKSIINVFVSNIIEKELELEEDEV